MKQLIIARKDLNMSSGKLAAQVSHASMAFLTNQIRQQAKPIMKYISFPTYRYDSNGNKIPAIYKRVDLCKFAYKNFSKGEDFFTIKPVNLDNSYSEYEQCNNEIEKYKAEIYLDKDTYENWIQGIFTKIICEAKNKEKLLKCTEYANILGLQENIDYFLIKDNCLTELQPEEIDENNIGKTLTCIGFRPLPDDIVNQISKKYQLYR